MGLFSFTYFLFQQTDLHILFYLYFLLLCLLVIDFSHIPLSVCCFSQLYLHSSPYTKNVCSRTYILNLHVGQILSVNFFLLDIPLYAIHHILRLFSPACVYDQYNTLLLLFLFLFFGITSLIFFLCLTSSFHIFLSFYISAQILYDICSSMTYVLNFDYPFGCLLCFNVWFFTDQLHYNIGGFCYKLFNLTGIAGGYLIVTASPSQSYAKTKYTIIANKDHLKVVFIC